MKTTTVKCDRCGTERVAKDPLRDLGTNTLVYRIKPVEAVVSITEIGVKYDLCEKCTGELQSWIMQR